MHKNVFNFLYIFLFFLGLFEPNLSSGMISHIQQNYARTGKIFSDSDMEKIEDIYVKTVWSKTNKKDPICLLSEEKKKELCKIIFEMPYLKNYGVYLNKVAMYKAKLPCIENEVTLENLYPDNKQKIFKQNMYPCFGRHKTIRTSFIEDDNYSMYFLSAGPESNSVTVYANEHYMNVVCDFIYNVDLLKLQDIIISNNEIIAELKLNKRIHILSENTEVEYIYTHEQNYTENDIVCDLPYEKKITLCDILFNQYMYKDKLKITLNKAATYLFNMDCISRSVHMSSNTEIELQSNQRMYPCHGRVQSSTAGTNFLNDPFINRFFISSGPRRNSIFVYLLTKKKNSNEFYIVSEFIENIDIRRLKSIIIIPDELIVESASTYSHIEKIMEIYEEQYQIEIINLLTIEKTEIENSEINLKILETNGNDFSEILEKALEETKIKLLNLREDKNQKGIVQSSTIAYLFSFSILGPQVFERLLDKKKSEIKLFLETQMIFPHTSDKNSKISRFSIEDPGLNHEVQELIRNMEIFVINFLQKQTTEVDTKNTIDNKKSRKKKKKLHKN